ncbi:dihydrolipoyllysine-residue acetyltransferase [Marinobacter sp. X15-166B]|uniref:dihydrolipoyllysine-residue acetyltransferase n=1 Tax=Marinobacter sp. X15-166B TaxID=1897620 RepID=UPI00085BF985|nr:dihydrolipoyllysine-residue acetyltransferase [Marinobacter sp. X15-166B]OEY65596.1 dihydrolipoyllysine-residue acetyltransferase [Marinobacter sp. X15-166B]
MSEQEITVPDLGGADEVEVIEIVVSAGDTVEMEDSILTLETDKASVELPSPHAGKITKITVNIGDKVKEGDVVGLMEVNGGSDASSADTEQAPAAAEPPADEQPAEAAPQESQAAAAESAPKTAGARQETVKVPSLDGMTDVPVIEINVSAGDVIEVDDPLVTVESDKATMEIPSPFAGTVDKVLVAEGGTLSEGDALVEMTVAGEGSDGGDDAPADSEPAPAAEQPAQVESAPEQPSSPAPAAPTAVKTEAEVAAAGTKVHAGPAVRKIARELGADLTRVKPSGPKNRILKEDVEQYIKQQLNQAQKGSVVATGSGIPGVKLPDFSQFGEVSREAMSRMQVATANNMQRSWLNVPHVTQFDDADITELENFRKSQKKAGEQKGIKMTPLPFLLKACARVLQELPQFNVSLDLERKEIVRKQYIHIGIAVDTPAGLLVPVIRDVDKKGLWELAAEAAELAQKARDKQLKPAEMQGACFTITSLGGIGGKAFTPIVNTPEVAILGVSRAQMQPVWDGASFQPRLMLPLSLSYDHRAVNGADGARFTNLLGELLGDIRTLLL